MSAATDATPSREEIREIVRGLLHTLKGDMQAQHVAIHGELEELATMIRDTRAEIARSRVADIRREFLPAANDELDAVVEATERATHAIMSSVEAIEAAADDLGDGPAQRVRAQVTAIYEACSFQDITGQRIRKVVKTLQEIDKKVAALLETLGADAADADARTMAGPESSSGELLEGPQLSGQGVSQADIDALFAS
jgi:chemotaxis protein CheZ